METIYYMASIFVGTIVFWIGVSYARIDGLREWRDLQQQEAAALKLENATLRIGHVDLVREVAFLKGKIAGGRCGAES